SVNLLTWDAASDDLPDEFTITASSGSNQSQHVDGSYYAFKTGSGSSQDLRLQSVARFNPSLYPAFDFTIEGLTLIQLSDESRHSFLVNISDALGLGDGAAAGVRCFWQGASGVEDRQLGQIAHWQSDGTETNRAGY